MPSTDYPWMGHGFIVFLGYLGSFPGAWERGYRILHWRAWQPCHPRMICGWAMGSHGYIWHAHAQWALIGYTYLKVIVAILSSSMLVCGKLINMSGWFKHIVRLQSCENRWDHALLSVKCCCLCVTDSHNFEVACLKKKLILVVWWLSGSVPLWCFLATLSDKDAWYVVIKGLLICWDCWPFLRH